jgi:thymidylate kinase
MRVSHPGGLVCILGIDGSGKTTLGKNLVAALRAEGVEAVYKDRHSSSGQPVYDKRLCVLASSLWNYDKPEELRTTGDLHLWFLFLAWLTLFDRVVIEPDLTSGRVVVTDLWWHKYAARFMLKDAFPHALLGETGQLVTSPDLLLMLRVEPAVAFARKLKLKATERGQLDGFEADDPSAFIRYQAAVQEKMLELTSRERQVIQADCGALEVRDAALAAVRSWLGERRADCLHARCPVLV